VRRSRTGEQAYLDGLHFDDWKIELFGLKLFVEL
jgi:hypothetical protein